MGRVCTHRDDAERLLRFVAEAESVGGDQPFSEDLLVELGRLVPADYVTYNELDRVRRRNLLYVSRPGDEDEIEDDVGEGVWDLLEEYPICRRHLAGDFSAYKLSDFFTLRELHQTRIYSVWFRQWSIEHAISVALPSPLWHTKALMFDRIRGRDFIERDRLVLNLLQPHLIRLWQASKTRKLLRAALDELDKVDENDPRGVILLGVAGDVEFVSLPARRLLRVFFPAVTGGRLPAPLADWLESGNGTLHRIRGARGLTVDRAGDALLLRERHVELELTAREREVLAWVARRKTNAEVARLLWLAPSPVRKHLENVYAKLGVSTRTAAVARFLGLLDAEAS